MPGETVFTILSLALVMQSCALENSQTCYNKFEYEYNVLETLITLKIEKDNLTAIVENMQSTLVSLTHTLQGFSKSDTSDGAVYIRWGKLSCPNSTEAEMVYSGFAAGGHYTHSGGGTNYLCLPRDPIFGQDISGGSRGQLYGAEYQVPQEFVNGLENHDVPCAVCRSPRRSVLTIPGRNQCYENWQLEYHGYLMSSHFQQKGKDYACVDSEPETLNSGSANQNGALLYLVAAKCGALKCPPYVEGQEITCAVCSYASKTTGGP